MTPLEWVPVISDRSIAAAYDAPQATILVQFPNGKRWWYSGCDSSLWTEFIDTATSKEGFIHQVLNDDHPNGEYFG